jgi:hypothetical protein
VIPRGRSDRLKLDATVVKRRHLHHKSKEPFLKGQCKEKRSKGVLYRRAQWLARAVKCHGTVSYLSFFLSSPSRKFKWGSYRLVLQHGDLVNGYCIAHAKEEREPLVRSQTSLLFPFFYLDLFFCSASWSSWSSFFALAKRQVSNSSMKEIEPKKLSSKHVRRRKPR